MNALASIPHHPKEPFDEKVFRIAMYWRVAYGTVRIFIGYKLLSLIGLPALAAYQHLFHRVLVDDPQARIFQVVGHLLSRHGYPITYFIAAHFLFWGLVDVVLSFAMLHKQLWAFIASIGLILLFVSYEIYRFTHTHSHILLAFIVSDLVFLYLIRHEYRRLMTLVHLYGTKEILKDENA